jgi:hypothetical protein
MFTYIHLFNHVTYIHLFKQLFSSFTCSFSHFVFCSSLSSFVLHIAHLPLGFLPFFITYFLIFSSPLSRHFTPCPRSSFELHLISLSLVRFFLFVPPPIISLTFHFVSLLHDLSSPLLSLNSLPSNFTLRSHSSPSRSFSLIVKFSNEFRTSELTSSSLQCYLTRQLAYTRCFTTSRGFIFIFPSILH